MKQKVNFTKKEINFLHILTDENPQVSITSKQNNKHVIVYIISGKAQAELGENKYLLEEHSLLFITPKKEFSFKMDSEKIEYMSISFNPSELPLSKTFINNKLEFIDCKNNPFFNDLFKKMDYYVRNYDKEITYELLKCLAKEVLCNLAKVEETSLSPTLVGSTIASALAIINRDLFKIKNIEEISKQLFISENYFQNIFRKQMKITPKKYITERRLYAAQDLIDIGKKPSEIYSICGFRTYTSFYRSYLAFFGYPPSKIEHPSARGPRKKKKQN